MSSASPPDGSGGTTPLRRPRRRRPGSATDLAFSLAIVLVTLASAFVGAYEVGTGAIEEQLRNLDLGDPERGEPAELCRPERRSGGYRPGPGVDILATRSDMFCRVASIADHDVIDTAVRVLDAHDRVGALGHQ